MPPVVPSAQAASPATTRRDSTKAPSSTQDSPLSHTNGPTEIIPQHGHQKLVFPDPIALQYLEEDPSTVVLHRRLVLEGYEVYIVEQWACSRIHPTCVIITYTGDPKHTVSVGVLSVPTDESSWSPRLKLYFNAITQYQARKKETHLGNVMVTDLGSFPSTLSVIPVPDGDVSRHREDFVVNENLKRLSCAGRAGLKLEHPSPATKAKFYQLYRTSDQVRVYAAVIELVKQCQIALTMFGILPPEYVDGLLCDVTENAISEWWADIGIDLYNIEPGDGVLGPTTVAALLGTYMGARNRLHAYGAPVGKDAFDIRNLKRAIESFQKSQKIERTRRLDRQTLDQLHRATAKAANAEGWTDAVKSTMAELGGHGGEMVMGMVRGREKGGIADIETLDLDNFASLVTGERAKWLWRGKQPKSGASGDGFSHDPSAADMMFMKNDQGYVWTSRKRHSHEDLGADRSAQGADRAWKHSEMTNSLEEKDQNLGRIVRKGVSGKVSDARIGFGRFKEAVGLPSLRSQHHRQAKECAELFNDPACPPDGDNHALSVCKSETGGNLSDQESLDGHHAQPQVNSAEADPSAGLGPSTTSELNPPEITIQSPGDSEQDESERNPWTRSEDDDGYLTRYRTQSSDASDNQDELQVSDMLLLRRPQSCLEFRSAEESDDRSNGWPRHLSFSIVEEVVLGWKELGSREALKEKPGATLEEDIAFESTMASDAHIFSSRMEDLTQHTAPWAEKQVLAVDELSQKLSASHDQINGLYLSQTERYQQIRDRTSDLLTEEHTSLVDTMKRVELMGAKLDYELSALESKVEDVEAGLGEFEQNVLDLEARIEGLIKAEGVNYGNSWFSWLRSLFGTPSR